jgi:hypothetical protein
MNVIILLAYNVLLNLTRLAFFLSAKLPFSFKTISDDLSENVHLSPSGTPNSPGKVWELGGKINVSVSNRQGSKLCAQRFLRIPGGLSRSIIDPRGRVYIYVHYVCRFYMIYNIHFVAPNHRRV